VGQKTAQGFHRPGHFHGDRVLISKQSLTGLLRSNPYEVIQNFFHFAGNDCVSMAAVCFVDAKALFAK